MIYVLAAIGAVTLAVLMWRAFGPDTTAFEQRSNRRPVAPDDDPEFLRAAVEELAKETR